MMDPGGEVVEKSIERRGNEGRKKRMNSRPHFDQEIPARSKETSTIASFNCKERTF
jgi:hypothetical protein